MNNAGTPQQTRPQGTTEHGDILRLLQERILRNILLGAVIFGTLIFIYASYVAVSRQLWGLLIFYAATYAILLLAALVRRLPYAIRSTAIMIVVYLQGTVSMAGSTHPGSGMIYLLTLTILGAILFNLRVGLLMMGASVLTLIGIAIGVNAGVVPIPELSLLVGTSNQAIPWITYILLFMLLGTVAVSSVGSTTNGLYVSLTNQRHLTRALAQERNTLENRIQDRTTELEQRAAQLTAASEVARQMSAETDLDQLLKNAVQLIKDKFGLYYTAVFLSDEKEAFAVLRSGTDEAGQAMLEAGHRLKIGEEGIVGNVVYRGEPRIALNVGADATHFKNPYLPQTQSEAALPMRVGNRVIGALDVQSEREQAFGDEDIRLLQTIADQLAVAIEKTSLVEQLEESLLKLETRSRETTLKTWRSHIRSSRRPFAYRYHRATAEIETAPPISETAQAVLKAGTPIIRSIPAEENQPGTTMVSVPIKMRDQVLGVLDVRLDTPTASQELINYVQMSVDRLGVALDNARLLEEIQNRAEREHLVSEITGQLRKSSEVNTILGTAAVELGRALGLSEVMVELRQTDADI